MLFSTSTLPVPLAALLVGASLLLLPVPGRAGDERISARHVLEGSSDALSAFPPADERRKLDLDDWRERSDGDSRGARALAARRLLEALEDQINTVGWLPFRRQRTAGQQILASLEKALPEERAASNDDQEPFFHRFRFNVVRGIEYRHYIPLRDQKLKLQLYGPLVSGSPGVGLQLRGRVAEHPFKLKAYGLTDEAGVRFELAF